MKRLKVSTYAREKKKSTQWVYDEIKKGNVESEKIDGVTFIIVKDEKLL